jgi:hypothetical protein
MKLNKLYILGLAGLLSLASCSEEFLDEPRPTDSVSAEVVFTSLEGAESLLSGIHRNMRAQFTATDAAGINSLYYARTVKGNDIIQAPTWFLFDYANDNREPTYRRPTFSWQFPYYIINQANSLINGVEASDEISAEDKQYLIGQGRALRGYMYFQLALEFNPTYVGNETSAAPPVYLETSLEGLPMITLQELYAQITSDLTFAVDNLTDYRLGKSYVNQAAAAGILAKVYLTMQNWSGAQAMSTLAYGGNASAVLNAASYGTGFADLNNPEWIWGYAQYDDQSNYYWGAPHAHADHFVLSYAATFFNNDFVELFSPSDVRNTFLDAYGVGDITNYRKWISTKFSFEFSSDFGVLRTAEMILTHAEALFQQGDESGAHDLLFTLQSNRDSQAVKSANTGGDLLDEILVERRKELYAEVGVEWFDAKRYGRAIPRTGNSRVGGTAGLNANDNRFFLKIPQSEIDANDNIDESVNSGR